MYDLSEEYKTYNEKYLGFLEIKRISFETGINFYVFNKKISNLKYSRNNNLKFMSNIYGLSCDLNNLKKIQNLSILLVSEFNKNYYRNVFKVKDDQMKIIGIPKHEDKWLTNLIKTSKKF